MGPTEKHDLASYPWLASFQLMEGSGSSAVSGLEPRPQETSRVYALF